MPVIPHHIEQYAEDGAFLWLLRDAAVRAPHYEPADLADLDERLDAHLDGLRIAGRVGLETISRQLDAEGEPGEVFVAMAMALTSGQNDRVDAVIKVIDDLELLRPAISAMGWMPGASLQGVVPRLMRDAQPMARVVALGACSAHRVWPGEVVVAALGDEPIVRARALRLIGEMGRLEHGTDCAKALADEDEECRFWAARSSVLLGDRDAGIRALFDHVASHGRGAETLDLLLAAVPVGQGRDLAKHLVERHQDPRVFVMAAGMMGDPAFVPWLIDQMADTSTARLAGEAFYRITGAELEENDLEPMQEIGEDDDDNVLESPIEEHDAELTVPGASRCQAFWAKHQSAWAAGQPYFLGRPISEAVLQDSTRIAPQRYRRAAALAVATRRAGRVLFNCAARMRFAPHNWD